MKTNLQNFPTFKRAGEEALETSSLYAFRILEWKRNFETEIRAKLQLYESLFKIDPEDKAAEEVIRNLKWILGEPTEPVKARLM